MKNNTLNEESGSGGIRTHEAYAIELESTPFDHSGTLPVDVSVLVGFEPTAYWLTANRSAAEL